MDCCFQGQFSYDGHCLAQLGEIEAALSKAQNAISIIDNLGSVSEIEIEVQVEFEFVECLVATAQTEVAQKQVSRFHRRLMERANTLDGTPYRESFLTGVPANVRLSELFHELGAG